MGHQQADAKLEKKARSDSIWAALVLGLPLSLGALALLRLPHFEGTLAQRYTEHPVEKVEIVLFCCALAALLARLLGGIRQALAIRYEVLPGWTGDPQPPEEAASLLSRLAHLPRSIRNSLIGQRCRSVLDYLCRRGSTAGLDDHIRLAADNDALAQEASYSFLRLVVWAIPMLGFLGTVLGITDAIAGVSPEQLEKDLSAVTGGLATAFDTTGLALMLTMLLMLMMFFVQRWEEKLLQRVDEYIDDHLLHRFVRPGDDNGPLYGLLEELVRRQAHVWAASLEIMEQRAQTVAHQQQERITAGLALALQQSLTAHEHMLIRMQEASQARSAETLEAVARLAEAVQQHQSALAPIAEDMRVLGQTLVKLQENEQQLVRMQHVMKQNLAALAAAGSFEEAVHSLTAAVHLLTARGNGLSGALRIADSDDRAAA